jgi:electron transport complex protein RnfG
MMHKANPEPEYRKRLAYSAALLGGFAMLAGAALTLGHVHTRDDIAARLAEDRQASLSQVIPAALHDNDLLQAPLTLALGTDSKTVFRATLDGQVSAVAFEMVGQGYGGAIVVLLGLDRDGKVLGARVIAHNETPGLGDKIEVKKDRWITTLEGHSLTELGHSGWQVKKDGGQFDQFTGATITPRAVITAVRDGLDLFAAHKTELLAVKK